MKKLIFAALVATACSSLWAANSLYWKVSNATIDGESSTFSYAQVAVDGYGVYLRVPDELETDDAVLSTGDGTGDSMEAATASVIPEGYGADNSFHVQLFDDQGTIIGYSDVMSYDALYTQGSIYESGSMAEAGATPWTVSTFHSVPEPTSGLLVLLGFAGLALRRRRA